MMAGRTVRYRHKQDATYTLGHLAGIDPHCVAGLNHSIYELMENDQKIEISSVFHGPLILTTIYPTTLPFHHGKQAIFQN